MRCVRCRPTASAPHVIGAHLEGPFLSPERLGTHPFEHRRDPDLELLDRLLDVGRVTAMTLAPELAGADELIRRLLDRGVVVSAGHTNATAEHARAAFDLGVSTHPPVQRDAPLPLARSRHRRRRADAPRCLRAVDRRRPPPRRRDSAPRLGRSRRPARARQRRDGGRGSAAAATSSATWRSRSGRRADARGRRARRHRADDDRRRPQPARARHPVRGRGRRRDGRAGAVRRSARSRHARARRRADIVVLDDRLEIVNVLCAVRRVSWLEAELREQPAALAPLLDREAGSRARGRGALPPRRRPLHLDRVARQLVECGALRAVPARARAPRAGDVRDAVAVHDLRAAAAARRRPRRSASRSRARRPTSPRCSRRRAGRGGRRSRSRTTPTRRSRGRQTPCSRSTPARSAPSPRRRRI